MTSAVRQIRQVPGLAGSGYGNAAYQAVAGLSAAMSLTDGLLSLSNPTLSASLTVGGSGKYSTAQAWSATAVPTTIKAGELSVTAGRDLHMVGTRAKVTGDLWLDAGRNILIESAQSTAGSSAHQSSWNAGIGWGGSCSAVNGCSGGLYAEGSFATERNGTTSLTNQNAQFDVGGHAHVGSGHDTTFRGVVLTAGAVNLDVGHDFRLESVQDTSHGAGSSSSFGASGTVGTTGFNGSVSGGGSTSSSDRAWVTEQSGIYTTNGDLNAHVGHNTTLIGSVMEAQGGKVNLDTQTLTMRDLQDHDVGTSAGGQVGLGYGEQQTGLGQQGQGSVTLSGQYAAYDIERTTKAAIGEGTITVRDEAHSQTTAAEANRDTANTQVITKNERAGVQVYVSSSAIQAIAATVDKVVSTLLPNQDLTKAQVKQLGNAVAGQVLGDLTDDMIRSACKSAAVSPGLMQWLIPSAYAAAGEPCTVQGYSGRFYTIPHGMAEDCITAAQKASENPDVQIAAAGALGGAVAVCTAGAPECAAAVTACAATLVCAGGVVAVVTIGAVGAYFIYKDASGKAHTAVMPSTSNEDDGTREPSDQGSGPGIGHNQPPEDPKGPIVPLPVGIGSRINISNDGWDHVVDGHFSGGSASQFTISESQLKSILQQKSVIQSPLGYLSSSGNFIREVDMGYTVGLGPGKVPTSTITIITDKAGNLLTAFPGTLTR